MFLYIESILPLFLLGLIPTLIRISRADVVTIGIVRLVIAIIGFTFFVLIRNKKIIFKKKYLLPCMAIGLCFGMHWVLYFMSIRFSGVTVASLCIATNGVMMLFMSRFLFREHINLKDLLALTLTMGGSILVVPAYSWGENAVMGFALGFVNAFFFAMAATLQKYYAKKIPNETRTLSQYLFALPVFLILWPQTHWSLSIKDWIILFILGLFCTAIAHTLWIQSLERLPAKTSAILYYLSTFFAVITGIVVIHEMPSARIIGGGILIVIGGILALYQRSIVAVNSSS